MDQKRRAIGEHPDPAQEHQHEAEDSHRIGAYRQAGLNKDLSRIPDILADLPAAAPDPIAYHPWTDSAPYVPEGYVLTMLRALAQLGAVEALPHFRAYAGLSPSSGLSRFAAAAVARLASETEQGGFAAQVRRMLLEMSMTPQDLNIALDEYLHPKKQMLDGRWVSVIFSHPPPPPLGVFALRELADMIYQENSSAFASLAELTALDFSRDYPCALKLRLAPLSALERLTTLIAELSRRTVVRGETSYDIQLAINAGAAAAAAAAAELDKIAADRAAHNQEEHHAGFSCLFAVIAGVGDSAYLPVLERFREDLSPFVGHYAATAHNHLLSGWKRERVPAY